MSEKIVIGITCVGSLISQGIIKSINSSDLKEHTRLIGFEYFEGMVGSYWVERTHILPDILKPEVTEEAFFQALVGHIRHHGIRFLFIGMDFELPVMARHREEILEQTGCIVIVSSPEVIAIAEDKYRTYEFLAEHGLPCPETWKADERDSIVYPAVVKPRRGERSRGVQVVRGPDELEPALSGVRAPMIQQCVGTVDDEYTCAILFLDDSVQTFICMRRYLKDGNTSVAFHQPDYPEAIETYVTRIAEQLHPFGPCNLQVRLDGEGQPRLFEINARFSGTTFIRTLFGVNEVEYLIKKLSGKTIPVMTRKYGKVLRYLEEMYIPSA
jgi:carbamoyl-phosphate synthase large subunit